MASQPTDKKLKYGYFSLNFTDIELIFNVIETEYHLQHVLCELIYLTKLLASYLNRFST